MSKKKSTIPSWTHLTLIRNVNVPLPYIIKLKLLVKIINNHLYNYIWLCFYSSNFHAELLAINYAYSFIDIITIQAYIQRKAFMDCFDKQEVAVSQQLSFQKFDRCFVITTMIPPSTDLA